MSAVRVSQPEGFCFIITPNIVNHQEHPAFTNFLMNDHSPDINTRQIGYLTPRYAQSRCPVTQMRKHICILSQACPEDTIFEMLLYLAIMNEL